MSETVNMPAKQDFSLFHSGAETTPVCGGTRCQEGCGRDWHGTITVGQKTLEGLSDFEFGIEDDQAEADGEGVVGSSALEIRAEGMEGCVVGLGGQGRREVRAGSWPADGDLALDLGGVVGGERCVHEGVVAIRRGGCGGVRRCCVERAKKLGG